MFLGPLAMIPDGKRIRLIPTTRILVPVSLDPTFFFEVVERTRDRIFRVDRHIRKMARGNLDLRRAAGFQEPRENVIDHILATAQMTALVARPLCRTALVFQTHIFPPSRGDLFLDVLLDDILGHTSSAK